MKLRVKHYIFKMKSKQCVPKSRKNKKKEKILTSQPKQNISATPGDRVGGERGG